MSFEIDNNIAKVKLRIRRKTSTEWAVYNEIIPEGEPCLATDTGEFKIGDGKNKWSGLKNTTEIDLPNLSINSDQVKFKENLKYTSNIGVLTIPSGRKYGTIESADKTLTNVLDTILKKEVNSQKIAPKLTLTATIPNNGASLEIGSYIKTINYRNIFTDGGYTQGTIDSSGNFSTSTAAGCTVKSYKTSNDINSSTNTTSPDGYFTFGDGVITIDSTTEKTYAIISSECEINAPTKKPATNLEVEDNKCERIEAGTISSNSVNIKATGYRNSWYYVGEDHTTAIDSNFIRTHGTPKNMNTTAFGTIAIPGGTKRVLIVVHGDHTLKKVVDVNSGQAFHNVDADPPATPFTTYKNVQINGANNFSPDNYSVFEYINVDGMAKTSYTFTIS